MSDPDDFFIGYLPAPKRDRRFFLAAAPALVLSAGGLGGLLSAGQGHPGHGSWDLDSIERVTGTLVIDPYPTLLTEAADGTVGRTLLVGEGKTDPLGAYAACAGEEVTVAGSLLSRDGHRMLAIPPDLCQTPIGRPAALVAGAPVDLGPVATRGRIVDSKCFFGAMRPGDGKAHKACAALCIKGGIPPALFVDDAGSDLPPILILTGRDGGRADDAILPLVADPIELFGRVTIRDGLAHIAADPDDIRRV